MRADAEGESQGTPAQTAAQQDPVTTTLLFDTENGATISPPKQQEIVITPSLAKVFVMAASTAHTQEPPLSFSTLLVAMLASEDGWLKRHFETQQANFAAISRKRSYDEASLRRLNEQSLQSEYLTTVSARAALEEARRIAGLASNSTTIDVRHVCAAYPVLEKWHLEDFANFEIDRLEWARAFGAEMAREFPKERTYWRAYADRASPVPLTSFSADVYTDQDLLGIDRSVDALALLLASTRTVTPLAIGVFGPWGSGKSFFMRHLQKRIIGLRGAEKARIADWQSKRTAGNATAADAPLYFADIAQVEFNAWHYNEANLVASLVEHLFRNLRFLPEGEEGDLELAQRRAGLLKQLNVLKAEATTIGATIKVAEDNVFAAKAAVADAEQAVKEALQTVDEKAGEIDQKKNDLQTAQQELDKAVRAIELKPDEIKPDAVVAVALKPLLPLFNDIKATIAAARNSAFDWKEFIARIFTAKGLAVVALCVAVPLILDLATQLQAQWTTFTGAVMAALAVFRNAFDVLKRHRETFERTLAELDAEQQKQVEEARATVLAEHGKVSTRLQAELDGLKQKFEEQRATLATREAEVIKAAEQLAESTAEHQKKLSERVAAQQRFRDAEAEYKRLSSALLLEEFIKDRSSTDEYRKQLGFLALVRRDIERLSELIANANRNWLGLGNQDPPPPVNRIVLYIDDLDRCNEKTVLAVLEAVHLLLAFPLFACAVAVDPRWVETCLREAHKHRFVDDAGQKAAAGTSGIAATSAASLGDGKAPATVGDYLEKIFQIPIWMSPIESRTRAALVNSLLGPTAAPPPRRGAAGQGAANALPENKQDPEGGAYTTLLNKVREKPDPLLITADEATFIEKLGELLSDRPRALKRFVNIYRLLKASLPDIDRASFVTTAPSSPHKICLSQLAFFTSHPRLAPVLVGKLEETGGKQGETPDPTADPVSLATWVGQLDPNARTQLQSTLQLIPEIDKMPLAEFCKWLPLTSRYLFHRRD
jgi:hypothetical protein